MSAVVAAVAALTALTTVGAGSFINTTPAPVDTPYLSAAVGYFDAFRESNEHRNNSAADMRVEFNPNWAIYKRGIVTVSPFVGAEATTDGSLYGLGGLAADLQYHKWFLTPSFGVGAYWSGSDGKNMGSPLEFRSQVETGYEFDNQSRLGVALSHISNANVSNTNPGSEIISLYYHHPVSY